MDEGLTDPSNDFLALLFPEVRLAEELAVVVEALAGAAVKTAEGAAGTTTLFRAVSSGELADIEATGAYQSLAGQTEGKYFFDTAEQASNFAKMMGDGPYTTTSVEVLEEELSLGQRINPAGERPGYFFPSPNIPSGPVNIFNFSVVP